MVGQIFLVGKIVSFVRRWTMLRRNENKKDMKFLGVDEGSAIFDKHWRENFAPRIKDLVACSFSFLISK